eukprot:TRINITY_DN13520_c0_g2_i1.p1 TRINITY_DN13520_c0_g2~~TRINITY_DN13520_c0_g2_i1.p1  ORF type:complete len:390 (+),score=6.78 TRINITY_DN13520_c0_g2_i1:115-1170(+)
MGDLSLLTQLRAAKKSNGVFAHCLGGEELGGGSLIFGTVMEGGLQYTSILDDQSHYFVQLNGISVAGHRLTDIDPSSFASTPDLFGSVSIRSGGVIIDSGTTLAMFPSAVYSVWLDAITALVNLPRVDSPDFQCYAFGSSDYKDLSKSFPTVTLHFEGADMTIEPPGYVFLHAAGPSLAACIGWQPMLSGDFSKITVIGDIILRNHLVVYDTDSMKVGWAPYDCSVGTITADGGEYNVSIVVGADLSTKPASTAASLPSTAPSSGSLSLLLALLLAASLALLAGPATPAGQSVPASQKLLVGSGGEGGECPCPPRLQSGREVGGAFGLQRGFRDDEDRPGGEKRLRRCVPM